MSRRFPWLIALTLAAGCTSPASPFPVPPYLAPTPSGVANPLPAGVPSSVAPLAIETEARFPTPKPPTPSVTIPAPTSTDLPPFAFAELPSLSDLILTGSYMGPLGAAHPLPGVLNVDPIEFDASGELRAACYQDCAKRVWASGGTTLTLIVARTTSTKSARGAVNDLYTTFAAIDQDDPSQSLDIQGVCSSPAPDSIYQGVFGFSPDSWSAARSDSDGVDFMAASYAGPVFAVVSYRIRNVAELGIDCSPYAYMVHLQLQRLASEGYPSDSDCLDCHQSD